MSKRLLCWCTGLLAALLFGFSSVAQAQLSAVIATNKGDIELRLRPDAAPTSVANFVNLAELSLIHI